MRSPAPRRRRHSSSTTPRSFSISTSVSVARPAKVGQRRDPTLEQRVAVGRHLEHVHRLVERRVGVCIGAEAQPDRFEVRRQLVGLKCAEPLKFMCSHRWARPRWSSVSTVEPALTASRSVTRFSGLWLARMK